MWNKKKKYCIRNGVSFELLTANMWKLVNIYPFCRWGSNYINSWKVYISCKTKDFINKNVDKCAA